VAERVALRQNSAKTFLSACPTHSLWFEHFLRGYLLRMGQAVQQALAISIRVLLALLLWATADNCKGQTLAFVRAFCCIAYGGSFRGNEVFLTDLFGLIKYTQMAFQEDGVRYIIVPLLGRFKSEDGERYHLTPLAYTTASGITIGCWVERLVMVKSLHHVMQGPAFSDRLGKRLNGAWLEMEILDRLHAIQTSWPDLIPQDVNVHEDYEISRSFRRGATTQARNKGVKENAIDAMNRWMTSEQAPGLKPRLKMQDHYSNIWQMVLNLLRFSKAL
jgi:hypothetical protein